MGDTHKSYWGPKRIVIYLGGDVCETGPELMDSDMFAMVLASYCDHLVSRDSELIRPFVSEFEKGDDWSGVLELLKSLAETPLERISDDWLAAAVPQQARKRNLLNEFVEGLYDYWRSFNRYLVLNSEPSSSDYEERPYRYFNVSVERLAHLARGVYRDICENITGDHPRVYRQVAAGVDVGLIATQKPARLPDVYEGLVSDIPFIRQVWIDPPVIMDPPMNKKAPKGLSRYSEAGLQLPGVRPQARG